MDELHKQSGRELLLVDVNQVVVAIPIDSVKEVIEYTRITQVPMCNKEISGVINVRGSVVPVIDAASCLGFPSDNRYDKYSCIILYESQQTKTKEQITIALVVTRVRSIKAADEDALYDKPSFGTHIPTEFIEGMVKVAGDTMPILEMSQLLDPQQINRLMLNSQNALLAQWES